MFDNIFRRSQENLRTMSGGAFMVVLVLFVLTLAVPFASLADGAGTGAVVLLTLLTAGIACALLRLFKRSRHAQAYVAISVLTAVPVLTSGLIGGGALTAVITGGVCFAGLCAYIAKFDRAV
ncbi:MAG TPA: hypothetical protein V6C81_19450 [Planktothrix sp.]|jgi:hypothetical protein